MNYFREICDLRRQGSNEAVWNLNKAHKEACPLDVVKAYEETVTSAYRKEQERVNW